MRTIKMIILFFVILLTVMTGCINTNYMDEQHADKKLGKLKIGMPMKEAYKIMNKPLIYSIPILSYTDSENNEWFLYFIPTNEIPIDEVRQKFKTSKELPLFAVTRMSVNKEEYYYLPHALRGKNLTGVNGYIPVAEKIKN